MNGKQWEPCRLCGFSFEYEDGLPARCNNDECPSNDAEDEMEQALRFAIALGFIVAAPPVNQ